MLRDMLTDPLLEGLYVGTQFKFVVRVTCGLPTEQCCKLNVLLAFRFATFGFM